MDTAINPKSLRSILVEGSPLVCDVVSVHDLPDMGTEDFMVALVKVNDEFYADSVICTAGKLVPGTQAEFTADAEGSFPTAKNVEVGADGEEEASA